MLNFNRKIVNFKRKNHTFIKIYFSLFQFFWRLVIELLVTLLFYHITNYFYNFFTDFDGFYIVRTDEGRPRPKNIFNKCGTNIYFFYSTEVWSITITEFYLFLKLGNIIPGAGVLNPFHYVMCSIRKND